MSAIFKHKAWPVAATIIALVYCCIEAQGYGDFYIFMSASGQLLKHGNIYYYQYFDSYNYFYSVLFALVLAPFYTLSFYWVKLGWLILNMGLYVHLLKLLAGSNLVKALNQKQARIFLFCVFLFSFRFLHENIHASQVSILILWCCVYGLYCIQQNKAFKGGALLALGINIKLLPVVLLPYLLYRGYFRAFLYTMGFYGLAMFLPSLIIGHDYNLVLIKSWLELINPLQKRHILDVDERSFHSLTTLLSTLMVEKVPDTYALPLKRNIADVSLATLSQIILATRAVLVLLTLYFLKWPPFVKARQAISSLVEISYLLLLIPLIFPHQQHYAFLFAAPAFSIVLYVLIKDPPAGAQQPLVIGLLSLVYLCTNLKLLLGEFNEYYEHYKLLTYGALLLIPLLFWVSRRLQKNDLLVPEN